MTFGKRLVVASLFVTSAASIAVIVPAIAQDGALGQPTDETLVAQNWAGPGGFGPRFGRGPGGMGPGGMGPGGMGPGGMGPGGMIHQVMEQFDADKDGKLTQAEIDTGLAGKLTSTDADSNGSVSLAEFEALWLEQTRPMMVRMFQNRDADGDGAVTAAEFSEGLDGIVARMDRNGDGALDQTDRPQRGDRRGPGHDHVGPGDRGRPDNR